MATIIDIKASRGQANCTFKRQALFQTHDKCKLIDIRSS